jgi:hypothetical protein
MDRSALRAAAGTAMAPAGTTMALAGTAMAPDAGGCGELFG